MTAATSWSGSRTPTTTASSFDAAEFRWLGLIAGPGLLVEHHPLTGPTVPDQSGRIPLAPFDPPEVHPGQLEIEA